jgi:dynein heavy chain, axonemal
LPFKSPDEALKQVDYFLKKIDITASIPFPIILFSYMIQHTIHVCRVLRAAGGNALLLGSTGSGKRTCTKLAACMLDIMVIEIEPDSCRYEKSDWSESIKRAVRSAGSEMKSTVVFFADRRIQTQNILADIGQILKKSAIKSLFTDQEIAHLMVKTDKSIVAESDADYWESFQEQCSCNLHFVVSLKAEGAELAHMLLNNPFLLSSCTVQWFAEFPSDSYRSIAAALIPRSLLDKGTWGACQEGSARMHTSAVEISHTFSSQPTRFAHVTPILFFDFIHHFTLLLRKQLEGLNFQLQRCHDAIEILTRAHNWADSVNSQSTDSSGISDVQDQSFKLASFVSKEISRWKGVETVLNLKKANAFGDILLAAGFITYMGVFSAQYRFKFGFSFVVGLFGRF